jgi:hypothetical protein
MRFNQLFSIAASLTLVTSLIQPPAQAQSNDNSPVIAQVDDSSQSSGLPGWHFGFFPWQYSVKKEPVVTLPQDEIGLIVANDGSQIPANRILAKRAEAAEHIRQALKQCWVWQDYWHSSLQASKINCAKLAAMLDRAI